MNYYVHNCGYKNKLNEVDCILAALYFQCGHLRDKTLSQCKTRLDFLIPERNFRSIRDLIKIAHDDIKRHDESINASDEQLKTRYEQYIKDYAEYTQSPTSSDYFNQIKYRRDELISLQKKCEDLPIIGPVLEDMLSTVNDDLARESRYVNKEKVCEVVLDFETWKTNYIAQCEYCKANAYKRIKEYEDELVRMDEMNQNINKILDFIEILN